MVVSCVRQVPWFLGNLENVDNVITVRTSRENLDSENPFYCLKQCPWRQSETMFIKYENLSNLEFGLIKT